MVTQCIRALLNFLQNTSTALDISSQHTVTQLMHSWKYLQSTTQKQKLMIKRSLNWFKATIKLCENKLQQKLQSLYAKTVSKKKISIRVILELNSSICLTEILSSYKESQDHSGLEWRWISFLPFLSILSFGNRLSTNQLKWRRQTFKTLQAPFLWSSLCSSWVTCFRTCLLSKLRDQCF